MNNKRIIIVVTIVLYVVYVLTVAHEIRRTIKSLTETKHTFVATLVCNQRTHI